MNKIFSLFILYFSIHSTSALANKLPNTLAVPGGIVSIILNKSSEPAPKVFFAEQKVLVTKNKTHWLALVGIPLSAKSGEHEIRIESATNRRIHKFNIIEKDYPAQHLTIKKKGMVSGFSKKDLEKISADKKQMSQAKATWTKIIFDTHFIAPVEGRLSSLFGLKRFLNNIPKTPHNGLDIAAPTGTNIIAPASAQVINTGNYYFNGNTVFLDHGQGLLSAYLHMNEILVKPGQSVKQGEKLGTVGATGRVTGPHLHWIIYLNKTPVDPALFIADDIPRLDARNIQ